MSLSRPTSAKPGKNATAAENETHFLSQTDRINARRARIEANRLAKNRMNENADNDNSKKSLQDLESNQPRLSMMQIQSSLKEIEDVKVDPGSVHEDQLTSISSKEEKIC